MRSPLKVITAALMTLSFASFSQGLDVAATATALRMADTITGGFMPSSDPIFAQMVAKITAGDLVGAASLASGSKYFGTYLARRLALQMQNPNMDASAITDSDATAFIVAHFIGGGGMKPSISTIWSENATYQVSINGTQTHAAALTAAQKNSLDWGASLVRTAGQNSKTLTNGTISTALSPINQKHVGGYLTLSDRANDTSFAMYGASAGTNLRMIEGVWMVSTGLQLVDVQSTKAPAQDAPRFIPEYNPNFFLGKGQAACISCHGGGMSSLTKGYATVADLFDFDKTAGLVFITAPVTATMKSLGSDPKKRAATATCDLVKAPGTVCNPDSVGVDPNQGWDVGATWSSTGVLDIIGWKGPVTGQGLNSLGQAIGQSRIVYEFLTKRVINEICPMGVFTTTEVYNIAQSANPFATTPGTDDIRTIVSQVAAHPTCL